MTLNEKYDFKVVQWFSVMSVVYLAIGTLVGVYIASELAWPWLNMDIAEMSFGRLRPLHTNLVIFAFGGSALMAAAFYIVQRTNQTKLWSNKMAWFTFWSWNLVILGAIITLPMGLTQSKEYAELEWPIDILITISWASYLYNFVMTIHIRDRKLVPHVYVANWFFLGMMVMVTYLHVVNNLSVPVGWFKSYSIFSGVQDAMIQWWWGHNAVGFFLTAGFLGMMYYFVPKQAQRPIYSYRLSVIHFWALMFGYVWLGAHHLQYTALPDWAGSLGAAISLAMIIPSWGGAINGILTLSGAWDRLRDDYILRFLIISIAFYAMSTFEGPVMASKTVNALSHYTDWTIGHVHSGALGWNLMVAAGSLYHMIERIFGVRLNQTLLGLHFWLHTLGAVTYIVAMWVSGIMQGLMWRAYDEYGQLAYTFSESVAAVHPYYVMRTIGGMLVVTGVIIMLTNIIITIRNAKKQESASLIRTAQA